jgi:protein-disulfide isomerase
VLGQVLQEFRGKVRVVHKDFPLPSHAGALPAAEAARCAGAQGVFWEYHDLLYLSVPDFSRDDLVRYAGRLGIDRDTFAACIDTRRFRKQVEADVAEGRAIGLNGTPTFLVNGTPLVGAQPIEAFREAIREALKEAGAR